MHIYYRLIAYRYIHTGTICMAGMHDNDALHMIYACVS
jgi:hypothetical protein